MGINKRINLNTERYCGNER